MKLRPSERKRAKIKMALQGSAGSGKTFSSLLIAKGLTEDNLSKVALIDSENGSSDLYAHIGNYNVLELKPPFTPEKYIEAIEVCENAQMELIIIDSISHVWDELLDFHSKLAGNSFTNWNKVNPRHKAFIDKILQSNCHVIATMRTKQDYVLNQKNGKFIPEKVGLKAIQRDGVDYEFTIVLDIDNNHFARASKDRTNIFINRPDFKINSVIGRDILEWCNQGKEYIETDIKDQINKCLTISDLMELYKINPSFQKSHKEDFLHKKNQLEYLLTIKSHQNNGVNTNKHV